MVFALTTFTILPEGLAAGWAALFHSDPAARGFDQGLIMAASPVGFVIGGLVVGRLVREPTRRRLVKPFAVLTPAALALTMFAPNAPTVAALAVISGIALGGLMPTLNGEFVLALPHGYRARAYGVMQSGVQFTQFFAVVVTGALAQVSSIPLVVGVWSVGGLLLMTALVANWPKHDEQDPPPGPARPGSAGATHVTPGPVLPSTAGKLDR
jgi:MFS family permease